MSTLHTQAIRDRISELESAGRALLEWDKFYPHDDRKPYTSSEDELTAIIERFRGLLESSNKSE